ncbi:hypothetical protein BQ08700 [Bartonella quintana str. Toulouse]|uniref:Ribbon-helix-helix domain-containing protein n=1 Tax=Bartonella quintana (strain Toulouse) TaxID=283165 RepID=A0A0H3LUI6_BARQU|nr:hypothetical protein BQ08700 [Bartonella quintana str. Toulouse]
MTSRKISVRIDGHATSVSLEQPFLDILKAIAYKKGQSLAFIITDIAKRTAASESFLFITRLCTPEYSLSPSLVFVLSFLFCDLCLLIQPKVLWLP